MDKGNKNIKHKYTKSDVVEKSIPSFGMRYDYFHFLSPFNNNNGNVNVLAQPTTYINGVIDKRAVDK